jgi:hypothetical protein
MDPAAPYDAGIFQRMQALMDAVAVSDPQRLYKGGRYGMAQQLRSIEMPELQDFSLGQVCHIVQLAISKKIVGYKKGGALVPYKLSDSCMKNKEESSDSNSVDLLPTIKTVAELRTVLMVLWMNPEHHQGLPLSLVKDKIELSAKRTLSEHQLGFSKLSHLFSMPELEGCCELRHDEPFQPVLCPPSLVIANGASKPSKPALKASTPAVANEVAKTGAPTSDEAKLPWYAPAASAPVPAFPLPPEFLAPLLPMPPMSHWPPITDDSRNDPMTVAMSPMTLAMVDFAIAVSKANTESSSAGLESPAPPYGKAEVFPEGLSLDPEVITTPPSLDPHGPRDPEPQYDSVEDLTPEPSTDFIEALLADDEVTPPPSFLAVDENRMTPRRDGCGKTQIKTSRKERVVEVLGAMLNTLDTAWTSNVDSPGKRGRKAGR